MRASSTKAGPYINRVSRAQKAGNLVRVPYIDPVSITGCFNIFLVLLFNSGLFYSVFFSFTSKLSLITMS